MTGHSIGVFQTIQFVIYPTYTLIYTLHSVELLNMSNILKLGDTFSSFRDVEEIMSAYEREQLTTYKRRSM